MASYQELAGLLGAFVRSIKSGNAPKPNAGLIAQADRLLGEAARDLTGPTEWTPFERYSMEMPDVTRFAAIAAKHGFTLDQVKAALAKEAAGATMFVNSRYQVISTPVTPTFTHLSIKRIDQEAIHDWRDLQRIKSELLGPECEAVEIYPAASRLVDQANQYHLWGFVNRMDRFPFGYEVRAVAEAQGIGEHQRPFEPGWLEANAESPPPVRPPPDNPEVGRRLFAPDLKPRTVVWLRAPVASKHGEALASLWVLEIRPEFAGFLAGKTQTELWLQIRPPEGRLFDDHEREIEIYEFLGDPDAAH